MEDASGIQQNESSCQKQKGEELSLAFLIQISRGITTETQ